jgi:hypothetical protein
MKSPDEAKFNTFVALDVADMTLPPPHHRQLVGTVVAWEPPNTHTMLVLSLPDDAAILWVPRTAIVAAYWAPAGYRPA